MRCLLAMPKMRRCTVDGCEGKHHGKGLCGTHYERFLKHGDPLCGARQKCPDTCTIEGCGRKHRARGFCCKHYDAHRNHGDPLYSPPPKPKPKVKLCTVDGCGKKHFGRGYCVFHHTAFRAYGDPLYRKRKPIEFNGQAKTISEWARELDIDPSSLSQRLRGGWPVERALTEPRGKFGPRAQAPRPSPP